ncbi:hypothetical protein SDC9_193481 [bioreactor metagenome]|uniref:DUF5067 domain-containing protein n=1 Tax=bioreactor metagenome TaxID=1076179 RepID=A0A645I566_9ZZZZ
MTLENKQENKIQLDQSQSTLVIDGEEYPLTSVRAQWDSSWYNDIEEDDENEGSLAFTLIPEDWSKAILTVTFRENITNGDTVTNTFYFVND